MPRPQQIFDWQTIVDERASDAPPENTAARLRWLLGMFVVAAVAILARAVQLEISDGANFRRLAAQPILREVPLAAHRGTIVDRHGSVLASDRPARAVAVEYRYLEQPPQADWIRRQARARLARQERRDKARLAESEQVVRDEIADLHRRLAALCGLSERQWQSRVARVDRRVKQLAASVNARRLAAFEDRMLAEDPSSDITLAALVAGLFAPPEQLPPSSMVVAEQRAFHRIVDDVPDEVVGEVRGHAERWPGVKIVEHLKRDYPAGTLAANLLGHVSTSGDEAAGPRGAMGFERRFDDLLTGVAGLETRRVDRRGALLESQRTREPCDGQNLELSIDARLQRAAESWLDRRTRPSADHGDGPRAASGAIVVLDIYDGDVLAAASSPRFDPNWFAGGDARVESVLIDPRRPLVDRANKMAIAPGSVFKPLTAIALVESHSVDPAEPFRCQGYFDEPDRLRCQIYRQHGVGHGAVTLADAISQSCNVYFFHHAQALGGPTLVEYARQFGFGGSTGAIIDDEPAGTLPDMLALRSTGAVQQMAIGQGTLTATPLQVARFYAAIANGGRLVTPKFVKQAEGARLEACKSEDRLQPQVSRLSTSTLDAIRHSLERVVDDPQGTAYGTVRLNWPKIAGKTGTAETGGGREDHAWFAGYVPADSPKYAFVVVLEHGGSGATAAGTIARQLVLQMRALDYFGQQPVAQKEQQAAD